MVLLLIYHITDPQIELLGAKVAVCGKERKNMMIFMSARLSIEYRLGGFLPLLLPLLLLLLYYHYELVPSSISARKMMEGGKIARVR